MELPDELLYGARVSVWSRWFLLVFGLLEVNYRVDYWGTGHILNSLYLLAAMSVNGYVHYRIHSGRPINIYWLLGLSVQDLVMTSFSTALSGGFDSRYAVFYYHSIAVVALVFASMPLTLIAVTVVATVYTALCLLVEPGLSFQMQEEKALLYRVIGMYGVGVVVSLITRYERMRRLAAVDREVRRERVEISQTIHDTTAQSAFMVGIGIETALQLAGQVERGAQGKSQGYVRILQVGHVGTEAPDRQRPDLQGPGTWERAEGARECLLHDNVHTGGGIAVRS